MTYKSCSTVDNALSNTTEKIRGVDPIIPIYFTHIYKHLNISPEHLLISNLNISTGT